MGDGLRLLRPATEPQGGAKLISTGRFRPSRVAPKARSITFFIIPAGGPRIPPIVGPSRLGRGLGCPDRFEPRCPVGAGARQPLVRHPLADFRKLCGELAVGRRLHPVEAGAPPRNATSSTDSGGRPANFRSAVIHHRDPEPNSPSETVFRFPVRLCVKCWDRFVHNVPRLFVAGKHSDLRFELSRLVECSERDRNEPDHTAVTTVNLTTASRAEHSDDLVAIVGNQLKFGDITHQSKPVDRKHGPGRVPRAAPSLAVHAMTMCDHHWRPINLIGNSPAQATTTSHT